MTNLIVKAGKSNQSIGIISAYQHNISFSCALGKNGITANKTEGDGKTPIGKFRLRILYCRSDCIKLPNCQLPSKIIEKGNIWCDDPSHENYNKFIKAKPSRDKFSYENLFRDDHKYDIIITLGYNDNPPIPNNGSAIFFHIAGRNYEPTRGCVAVSHSDMLKLLPMIDTQSSLEIIAR